MKAALSWELEGKYDTLSDKKKFGKNALLKGIKHESVVRRHHPISEPYFQNLTTDKSEIRWNIVNNQAERNLSDNRYR